MNKSDIESRREEAAALGTRLSRIVEYIRDVQEFASAALLLEVLRAEVSRANVRGLRLIERDVNEMLMTLESHEREELDAILGMTTDDSTCDKLQQALVSARRAIARGRVRSEKERVRLDRFAAELAARHEHAELEKSLRLLLSRD